MFVVSCMLVEVKIRLFKGQVKHGPRLKVRSNMDLKGKLHTIFYMLAKYVPGDIKYIFTKFYRHISTNNEANRKFVIFQLACDVLS